MRRLLFVMSIAALFATSADAQQWLRQSTASTVVLGPFVDALDGVAPETSLTISQADIRISKNGNTFAQSNNSAGATPMENGYFSVPLDATDTNSLGRLRVAVNESGALPVWQDFMVVPSNVHDSLVGETTTDKLETDVTQWNGTAIPGVDTAGYPRVTIKDGTGTGEIDTASGKVSLATSEQQAIGAYGGRVDGGAIVGVTSQTAFTIVLTHFGDPSVDNVPVGMLAVFTDSNEGIKLVRRITAYNVSAFQLNVDSAPDFTVTTGDKVDVYLTDPRVGSIFAKLPSKAYLTGTANADGDIELDAATGRASADVTYWSGDPVETPTVSGVPVVDITHLLGVPVCD